MHRELLQNSSGAVDTENPGFLSWVNQGYRQALDMVQKSPTADGYRFALKAYAEGFKDEHLFVSLQIPSSQESLWSGFSLSYINKEFVVAEVASEVARENPQLHVGDRLLALDGKDVDEFAKSHIFPYFYGDETIEANWVANAPLLLFDLHNPFTSLPKRATLLGKMGPYVVDLSWYPIDDREKKRILSNARRDVVNDFAIASTPPNPARLVGGGTSFSSRKGIWISIPTFALNEDRDLQKMEEIIKEISRSSEDTWIVIDIRGNSGGNSYWGDQMLRALYGSNFDRVDASSVGGRYALYRVSRENLERWNNFYQLFKKQNRSEQLIEFTHSIAEKMAKALETGGESFIRIDEPEWSVTQTPELELSSTQSQVFVLTDRACASSCWEFVRKARQMPGLLHIGLPTHSPTQYGEINIVELPSGRGTLGYPTSIQRYDTLKLPLPMEPHMRFRGDIRDTDAIQQWIETIGETQLHR